MKKTRNTFVRNLVSQIGSVFGRFGSYFSILSTNRRDGFIDYNELAGPRYDNSAVYAGIAWIQRRLTESRMIVERRSRSNWTEVDHELPSIIENGPVYDGATLLFGTVLSLTVSGNAYWYEVRARSGRVVGYILLDYFRVTPMNDKYIDPSNPYQLITYYQYRNPNGEISDIDPSAIVHFRSGIHPANPRLGMSPLASALREIVTDNEAAELGVALLRNGGIPGVAFEPTSNVSTTLDPDDRIELENRIKNRITGSGAGRPIFMPTPGSWKVIGFEPDKLVLNQTRALAVSRILGPLGIDPMVVGFPSENKTYSNYSEANEAAVENAFLPMLKLISRTLTRDALNRNYASGPRTQYRVGWDLSEVRALQADQTEVWNRVGAAWRANLIDRATALIQMGLEPKPGDERIYYSDTLNADGTESDASKIDAAEKLADTMDDDEPETE